MKEILNDIRDFSKDLVDVYPLEAFGLFLLAPGLLTLTCYGLLKIIS